MPAILLDEISMNVNGALVVLSVHTRTDLVDSVMHEFTYEDPRGCRAIVDRRRCRYNLEQ
jgi:hypothetical protein